MKITGIPQLFRCSGYPIEGVVAAAIAASESVAAAAAPAHSRMLVSLSNDPIVRTSRPFSGGLSPSTRAVVEGAQIRTNPC